METYSRIGLLEYHGNLQSYWTTGIPWKLTVVLDWLNFTFCSFVYLLRMIDLATLFSAVILHSKRVGKILNYTRNEWRRCKNTLKTSGENVKIHSKRVGKMRKYTRNEWRRCKNTLETSGEDRLVLVTSLKLLVRPPVTFSVPTQISTNRLLHSKRAEKMGRTSLRTWWTLR
jgi:hypothetical protein